VVAIATGLADDLANAVRLQEQWRFAAARDAVTRALARATDPPDRLALVTGRRMFAEVLRDLGEVDEAYAVAQPLVAECEERLGAGHPATARALTVLASVVHARGDFADAEHLYERALDGRFRESGPAGRAVRLARAYLALLYRDRGDTGRARTALDAAYKGLRRAYGITDPDAIRFGVELGRLCHRAGDVAAARRLFAVARAGCQARLDPWHPLSVLVERELAAVEPALRPAPPVLRPDRPERIVAVDRAERVRGGSPSWAPPLRVPAEPDRPPATAADPPSDADPGADAGSGPMGTGSADPGSASLGSASLGPASLGSEELGSDGVGLADLGSVGAGFDDFGFDETYGDGDGGSDPGMACGSDGGTPGAPVAMAPGELVGVAPGELVAVVPGEADGMAPGRAPGRSRRRLVLAGAAVTAALVATVLIAVAIIGVRGGGGRPAVGAEPADTGASAATGHQPLRVHLRDDGTTLVASWDDPAGGPVPVVVAVARDGGSPAVAARLPAGIREYTLTGADPHVEYCVIVAALYPGQAASDGTSACTRRAPAPR
jgi:Tetratricopeptide repeat